MPSYKVLSKGFIDGKMYEPNGKRSVLHRDKPFPSKDKKEQVPSWLEAIPEQTIAQARAAKTDGPSVKELKEKLTALGVEFKGNASRQSLVELLDAAEVEQGRKDIDDASFMGTGESAVETL